MDIKKLMFDFEQQLILQRYSPNSIRNYKSAVRSFLQSAENKSSHPSELNEEMIRNYLLWKIQKHKTGSSHQRMILVSIKKFCSLLYNMRLDVKNLYPSAKSYYLPNYLTKKEIVKLIAGVKNIKHRCIIKLLYGSGLRLGELLHLKVNDINLENMTIYIRKSKENNDRVVMLSETLLQELFIYFKKHKLVDYLFEGQNGGIYSAKSVQVVVKKAALKAEIKKQVTPHTLRHSFATHLFETGVDIQFIKELMGHKSITTTQRYTHIPKSKIKIKSPLDSL